MISTFLLIGPRIKDEFDKFSIDPKDLPSQDSLKGFFECTNEDSYCAAIESVNSYSNKNPDHNLHIIIYGHGSKDRLIDLGKKILPESIFSELRKSDHKLKIVVSVASCHAGFGIRDLTTSPSCPVSQKITNDLSDNEILVIYAGRRASASSSDTLRILEAIHSNSFIPKIIYFVENSPHLYPPETIKIATNRGVTKFSPLKIFRTNPNFEIPEMVAELTKQQEEINQIFLQFDELPASRLNKSPAADVEQYLQDLAFLIVLTKDGEKIDYLKYLVDVMRVDLRRPRLIHQEKHFLIIDACTVGNIAAAKFLIERDCEFQLNISNDFGVTALMAACYKKRDEIVIFLMQKMSKDQIDRRDKFGSSPLIMAIKSGCKISTLEHWAECKMGPLQ